jgi:hypothetical protein
LRRPLTQRLIGDTAVVALAATHSHLTTNLATTAQVHGEANAFWWSTGIYALGPLVAAFVLPTPPGWRRPRRQAIAAPNVEPCPQDR